MSFDLSTKKFSSMNYESKQMHNKLYKRNWKCQFKVENFSKEKDSMISFVQFLCFCLLLQIWAVCEKLSHESRATGLFLVLTNLSLKCFIR